MGDLTQFQPWEKIPRLNKTMVVTEKIDGTNAAIVVRPIARDSDALPHECVTERFGLGGGLVAVSAQSRKRFITPKSDNFGFAQFVHRYADGLAQGFGVGRHFGEWWGQGIQRGYGALDRYFSPFNTNRWNPESIEAVGLDTLNVVAVPVLYKWGRLDTVIVATAMEELRDGGTRLPYTLKGHPAEGVVVFHTAGDVLFKALLENDDLPKSLVAFPENFALAG